MSVLADAAFDRVNTKTNAPAFCEVKIVEGSGATLHVLLKGGGSDNASRVVMLARERAMRASATSCSNAFARKPPTRARPPSRRVGVGAHVRQGGGTGQARAAASVGSPAATEEHAAMEAELLAAVNALGIGPAALGGAPTALAVHIETAPCHIAALPVAVNMGCCAMRSASIDLLEENPS